jgi:hypothetical protein
MQNIPTKRTQVNGLQKLIQQKAPDYSMRWCVQAYALNKDILLEGGAIDPFYGIYIPLGSFATEKEAEEHAKKLIELTGYDSIIVARYASAVPLTDVIEKENIVGVSVNVKGKLVNIENSKYKQENALYEERMKKEQEIQEEAEKETVFEDVEYMKRNCFMAVKNYSSAKYHEDLYKKSMESYEERKKNIRKHASQYPEHKDTWLPILKDKLERRGETELYESTKNGFEKIKENIYEGC